MKQQLKQYQVEPDAFWQSLPMTGGDGYDAIELAERRKWHVLASWGRDGYNLGSWPLVIIFFRNREGSYDIAYYVEGDVAMYSCPTQELRNAITDELAFFHWKHQGESWVEGYESVEQLPATLRGPSWAREATEVCVRCERTFPRDQVRGLDRALDAFGQEVMLYACQQCEPLLWTHVVKESQS